MEKVTGQTIVLEDDVARVLSFMEREVSADRLEYVATRLPALAKIIWTSERCATLARSPIRATQSASSECGLVGTYAGDGSAAVVGVGEQT